MSDEISPTVRIKSDHPEHGGHVIIDAADFDPTKHEKFDPPPAPPAPPAPLPPPPGAPDPLAGLASNWRDRDAGDLRKLAEVVSGRAVENKKQAIEVIEAALAKQAK